ncbi:hypothetical protein [Peribacillus asahii]
MIAQLVSAGTLIKLLLSIEYPCTVIKKGARYFNGAPFSLCFLLLYLIIN